MKDELRFELFYHRVHDKGTLYSFLWMLVKNSCRRLICKVRGHKPKDLSCAGPNSGCVFVICERCDATLTYETLY